MAKKVFYNRRHKMPAWGQLYAVWGIVTAVVLGILFFTSVEKIPTENAPQLSTTLNGFAEGLFYELRDAEAGNQIEAILAHAKRLEKKHGYKIREEKDAGCKTIRLVRGSSPAYGIAAVTHGEKYQTAFALLTFLDRIAPQNSAAAFDARLIFGMKGCDTEAALAHFRTGNFILPLTVETGDAALHYDRVPDLKNLKMRRHFEQLFFMRERTLWANVTALIAGEPSAGLVMNLKGSWAASPEAELLQNPLLRHPAIQGTDVGQSNNVAFYLAADVQLFKGGFVVLAIMLWLLAIIPFANALGTFREKFDAGSALTSAVLYGTAFFGYFLLLKVVLNFAKADFAVTLLAVFLLPVVFIPVRILQKNLLRAELNRAGLHVLIQGLLTLTLFINPLLAFTGFSCLMIASGFSRADALRKIFRLMLLLALFAVFFVATRQPLGSFANFFAALLPVFSMSGILKIMLLALIGGNLVSLFFVPRERV